MTETELATKNQLRELTGAAEVNNFELRPYQRDAIAATIEGFIEFRHQLIVCPIDAPVVVASVQTLMRGGRRQRFTSGDFRLIVTDGAHHALAESEFVIAIGGAELASFEETMRWHRDPITPRQTEYLVRCGINPTIIKSKGHACSAIDRVMQRRAAGLATYKQVRVLRKFGVPDPHLISFARASVILDRLFSERSNSGARRA